MREKKHPVKKWGHDRLAKVVLITYLLVFLIYTVQGSYVIEQAGDEWSVSGYTTSEPVEDLYQDEPFPEDEEFVFSMHQYYDEGEQSIVFFSGAEEDTSATIDLDSITEYNTRITEQGTLTHSTGDWDWDDNNVAGGALEILNPWSSIGMDPDTGPDLVYADEDGVIELSQEPLTVYWEGVHPPRHPDPEDGEIVDDDEIEVSVEYDHVNEDSGDIEIIDSSGSIIGECTDLSPGARCFGDIDLEQGSNEWHAVAEEGDYRRRSQEWEVVYSEEPIVEEMRPEDGVRIYDDFVELEADVKDENDEDMFVDFYLNEENVGDDVVIGGEGTASITESVERGEDYEWYVEVTDQYGQTVESSTKTFDVNPLPTLTDPEPIDEGLVTEDDDLSVSIIPDSEEYEELKVYFEERGSEDILEKKEVDDLGTRVYHEIDEEEIDVGESFEWRVKASDSYENESTDWMEFTRVTSGSYRVEKELEYDYTTLILSENEYTDFLFTVENRISSGQELTTYLEGPNIRFVDSGEQEREYGLEGYESKEFHIELQPEEVRNKELEIVTHDRTTGINTTEVVPVVVQETPPIHDTRRVPGIGILQILFVVLLSTGLYFVRL